MSVVFLINKEYLVILFSVLSYSGICPFQMTFNKGLQRGRIIHDKYSQSWIKHQALKKNVIVTHCFPLYSYMLALNITVIDFLTLDVEGEELNVLKTIPFDKLTIKMITVEYMHVPEGINAIRHFMEKNGFETLLIMQNGLGGMKDMIFRKKI